MLETMFTFLDSVGDNRPIIYSGTEKPTKNFNAVQICLNGRSNASLDWKKQKAQAQEAVAEGFQLFWQLDLGLFSELRAPLQDQTQLLTLGLSIQHFRDTIWKEFAPQSIGISLYSGSIDFTHVSHIVDLFPEQSDPRLLSLSCCDAAVDYLNLLASQLPGELPVCVSFDISTLSDPLLLALLISKERFDRLHRVVSEGVLPISALTQRPEGIISHSVTKFPSDSSAKIGLCLPNRSQLSHLLPLERAFQNLKIPFRVISEATLTVEWDGLDEIHYSPKALSPQGLRKLNGFQAAGGVLINID